MLQRYSVREEPDGTCSIVDIFTAQPTFYFGRWLRRMPSDIAHRAIITMNLIDLQTQETCEQKPPQA